MKTIICVLTLALCCSCATVADYKRATHSKNELAQHESDLLAALDSGAPQQDINYYWARASDIRRAMQYESLPKDEDGMRRVLSYLPRERYGKTVRMGDGRHHFVEMYQPAPKGGQS